MLSDHFTEGCVLYVISMPSNNIDLARKKWYTEAVQKTSCELTIQAHTQNIFHNVGSELRYGFIF